MNGPNPDQLRPASRSGRQDGFTIVELMIAMLLGLIVIAGVSSVFLANQRAYRTNTALGDVQDASRIAFEMMARDIRQAGLTGCNSANGRIVNVLANAPANAASTVAPAWWANWGNAIRGYDDASGDPALADKSPVANTSSLQLIGAAGAPLAIKEDVPGTNFQLYADTDALEKGDVVMVCSPDHTAIVQITGPTHLKQTVDYNTGNAVSPGNCSSNLGYPNTACTGNSPEYTFPPNSLISRMSAVDWYIGTNPVNGDSLYRATLVHDAAGLHVQAQEMVRNVTNMTITYLAPGNPAINSAYQTATTIGASSAWGGVGAVRVTLKLRSGEDNVSADGSSALTRTYSFTTAVRNRLH